MKFLHWLIPALLLCLTGSAMAQATEKLIIPLKLNPAEMEFRKTDTGIKVTLPNYSPAAPPGLPSLPARTLHIALPADTRLDSIQISHRDLSPPVILAIDGRKIAPAPAPHLLCAPAGTCPAVTLPPAKSPRSRFELQAVGKLGPQVMATVLHRPVTLDSTKDSLRLYANSELILLFSRDAAKSAIERPSRWQRRLARKLALNGEDLGRFYPSDKEDPPEGSLVILTTEAIVQASQALPDFIAAHEERGYTVHLATEADFDTVAGQAPDERPQRVRAWLQQNAVPLNLEVALILANPDPRHEGLPMLAARVFRDGENDYIKETPTDAYFSDLSGNWDLDGDGRYGEWGDDGGAGGVDFYPELATGRIPYYGDPSALDQILSRTASYMRARQNTTWRRRILFPGSVLFFPDHFMTPRMEGGDVSEYMKPEFLEAGFDVTTMYEQAGMNGTIYEPDLPLTEDALIAEWNEGYGLVYWFAHGSEDAAWRTIWLEDSNNNLNADPHEMGGAAFAQSIHHELLPKSMPAFVFHGSCSNGTPENAANIGYTQLKSGAIASYSSTRVAYGATGWGWEPSLDHCDIFMLGYYIVSALRDGARAGEALAEIRAGLGDGGGWGGISWHGKMATSLYGDPSLSLASCENDADCDDGLPCNGLEICIDDICGRGQATDCSAMDGPCSVGQCNAESGECQELLLDGQHCDDGLFCTIFDRCAANICAGRERECSPNATCHVGRCDEEARACLAEFAPEDTICVDPQGVEGTCQQGLCLVPEDGCGCAGSGRESGWLGLGLLCLGLIRLRRKKNL
ncbi:MAG: hypothetical protein JRF33_14575 [Deltaproteobacteria bacterium]|nr:hypothetical protein [Deltaproteobacteria bacterium]